MRVRIENYNWLVVNTSGGKDSVAMMVMVVSMATMLGLKNRVVAVHCDLGEEEWKGTREVAEAQARQLGIRFEVVKRKQGGILAHVLERFTKLASLLRKVCPWPSPQQRWCTSDHKRGQVNTLFTRLADETRQDKGKAYRVRILNCMGMRAGESCAREKLKPFKLDKTNTNGRRIVHTWLPIHDWTLERVWQVCGESGLPRHYAYDLGMPRLSCVFCIYAPKPALLLAGKHNRPLLDKYVEVEDKVGYTFQAKLSLRSVRDALDRGEEPGPITTWEM